MELIVILFAVIVVIGFGVFLAYIWLDNQRNKKEPQYILYLLRVDNSGNMEIKKSKKPEMWEWRF